MTEIKCPKCGSTNAYNFQDKENWYRCRDCLEFLYANEHGVVACETLGKAARQYAISHNITVTSPLVAGIRTFFDEGGNDITSKIVDDWLGWLTTENKMKNYDGVNNSWGTTTIKVLFQVWRYKGSMIYTVGGNCKGLDVLPSDGMSIIDSLENAKFEGMTITPFDDDEWFAQMTLTSDDGDTLEYDVESESELEQMIVGMQIINFEEEG